MRVRVSETGNGVQVLGRRVPLVSVEAVARISAVQFRHLPVTDDFGHDRSGGNGGAAAIAVGHPTLGHRETRDAKGVDEDNVGQRLQGQDGALHGAEGGLMDVDGVDFARVGRRHAPGDGSMEDLLEEPLTLRRCRQLRIAHARDMPVWMQDDRPGDNRSGETSPADFIDAGDVTEADLSEGVLERSAGDFHTTGEKNTVSSRF